MDPRAAHLLSPGQGTRRVSLSAQRVHTCAGSLPIESCRYSGVIAFAGQPGFYNPRKSLALISGTRLGPYEILSPLGAGGMGEVYRVRDIACIH